MEATQGSAVGASRDSLLAEARARAGGAIAHVRHNPKLLVGLVMLAALLALGVVGPFFIDTDEAKPMSVAPDQSPSREFPFGTESQGRDMLALVVRGIPLTVEIGLIAGAIGLGIGTILGFIAGYTGGIVDTIIRSAADIMLTVPGLLVLIVVASSIKGLVSVQTIALVVASLAWMFPTRTIRAQVLSLRERPYVEMAKLNGMSTPRIIGKELVPNLLPYLGASFVGAVGAAILAAIGLEALGLGPQNEPTLGMTIYWAIFYSALLRGLWWWWAAPVGVIVILFVALFLIAVGLDELANPRLRRTPA
ncbi:MAG TPA: ABC transporter permease [Thermomicrobiales bacterium]|jgi:peptide/nickel transport system permease protein